MLLTWTRDDANEYILLSQGYSLNFVAMFGCPLADIYFPFALCSDPCGTFHFLIATTHVSTTHAKHNLGCRYNKLNINCEAVT